MPLLYIIDTEQACIFMYLSGLIDDWELGTKVQQLWEEQTFNPQFSRLIDASELSDWRADTALLRAIAKDVRSNSPRQIALVAQSPPVLTDFKIYVDNLHGVPACVVSSTHEATQWLNVHLPEPWPPIA